MPINLLEQQVAELTAQNASLEAQLRLLQQDQHQAFAVQSRLLPARGTCIGNWQLDYLVQPALHLSGDFLDFFSPQPNKLYFYLADVAGSGSASALFALLVKYLLRRLATKSRTSSPAKLCHKLNSELISLGLDKHLTLALGCLNLSSLKLKICSTAHLPQPLILTGSSLEVASSSGSPLGLFPTVDYKDYTCTLSPNSQLCFASDGVLEVMPAQGLQAKNQAWQDLVMAKQAKLALLEAALKQPANGWPDDLTLMTLSPSA